MATVLFHHESGTIVEQTLQRPLHLLQGNIHTRLLLVATGTYLIYITLSFYSFLWVKFFSDATTNQPGFVANLQNVDPICGSHISLNVTETVQVKNISVAIQFFHIG